MGLHGRCGDVQLLDVLRPSVNYLVDVSESAVDQEELGIGDKRAVGLVRVWIDDGVRDAGLIFKRAEDEAVGGPWPLPGHYLPGSGLLRHAARALDRPHERPEGHEGVYLSAPWDDVLRSLRFRRNRQPYAPRVHGAEVGTPAPRRRPVRIAEDQPGRPGAAQAGHDARLIPAQFVEPLVKSNKNDFIDAESIAEAVERKNMRFVPIKMDDQLDLQATHRSATD